MLTIELHIFWGYASYTMVEAQKTSVSVQISRLATAEQEKGFFAEDADSGPGICIWAGGEYPPDCHSNVECYHLFQFY